MVSPTPVVNCMPLASTAIAPARYYNPALQRFISEDPIAFNGGDPNLYAYVFNRPVSFRDPTGKLLIGAVVGGLTGGITAWIGAGLQHGSTSEIIASVLIGAGTGALLGLADPTEGVLTVGEIAVIGGGAGLAGDVLGQAIAIHNEPCKSFNYGEAIGAGVGGFAGGYTAAVTAVGVASVGGGELAQSLMGAGIGAAPATFGPPAGALLGTTSTSGRKDGDGCKE
jgi:hypothetical protein